MARIVVFIGWDRPFDGRFVAMGARQAAEELGICVLYGLGSVHILVISVTP